MKKKNKIIRALTNYPNLKKTEIAKRTGCSVGYVNHVENELRKSQAGKSEIVEPVSVPSTDTIDAMLTERGKRYGNFEDHARITQAIKHEIRQGESYTSMEDDMVEAIDMIAHKIGRIVNGDPRYADSWADIAGYAKLVADRLNGDSK